MIKNNLRIDVKQMVYLLRMLTKCLLKSMLAFSMNSLVLPSESSRLQRSYSSVGFKISAAASERIFRAILSLHGGFSYMVVHQDFPPQNLKCFQSQPQTDITNPDPKFQAPVRPCRACVGWRRASCAPRGVRAPSRPPSSTPPPQSPGRPSRSGTRRTSATLRP